MVSLVVVKVKKVLMVLMVAKGEVKITRKVAHFVNFANFGLLCSCPRPPW